MLDKAEIYILDVKFGDAIFIKIYHRNDVVRTFLIDTGRKKNILKYDNFLKENNINCLVITHKHGDHMAYASELVKKYKKYKLDSVFMRLDDDKYASPRNLELCHQLKQYIHEDSINIFDIMDDRSLEAGLYEFGFSLLYPKKTDIAYQEDPNRNSIILSLRIDDICALFMGDATGSEEKIIIARNTEFHWNDVRFIKIGHHGSDTSSTDNFLRKISDVEYGVLSVSKDKTYNLPAEKFIYNWMKYIKKKDSLLRTEDCNSKMCHTIKITIDRNGINEKPEFIS